MLAIVYCLLMVALMQVPTMGRSFTPGRSARQWNSVPVRGERSRRDIHEVEHEEMIREHNGSAPNSQKAKIRGAHERLLTDLFKHYNREVMPGTPTEVTMMIQYNCADYDEATHRLTSTLWESYKWNDERLTWDPSEYEDIRAIHQEVSQFWIPDITLYNGANHAERDYRPAIIYNSGDVMWIPQVTLKSYCQPTADKAASCSLIFGSWTYAGNVLPLVSFPGNDSFTLDNYLPGCPYKVINPVAGFMKNFYECCPEPYMDFNINFDINKNELNSTVHTLS